MKIIRTLLNNEIYNQFNQALKERSSRGHFAEITFIGVNSATIKEHKKIGNILSCVGRFYNTQRTGAEILKRSEHISFINDALTYLVDLFSWYMEDKKPKEIIAKGHGKIYRRDGYDVDHARIH